MNIRMDGIRPSALRRWVAHLLLLAFVARALIPVGYMPDFGAAAQGVFKIVICSAAGTKTLTVDAGSMESGTPDAGGGHKTTHDQPCAFSGLAAVAEPQLITIAFVAADFLVENYTSRIFDELPPARAGPAHGSRAPPQFS